MIFNFLRFFVQIALKFYFRTIYFLNESDIPDNEPIIVAGNHSNSALDAIIIDAFLEKNKLYWLARGDIYAKKWVANFMTSLRTAPIYRSSEVGFVDIKRNNESFEICFKILKRNQMVGIFPEGITVHERKLQTPFKKGFARLAFQAHEKLGKPIMILPVGVSYHSLTALRTDVFVKFGEAFSTQLFYDEYKENPANALKSITQYLENQLNKIIINYDVVNNQKQLNDALKQQNENLLLTENRKFGISTNPKFFEKELETVNTFIEKETKNLPIPLVNSDLKPKSKLNHLQKTTFYLLQTLAKMIYFIPNQISKYIIRTKIKKSAFWGSVRFVLLYALFPIYVIFWAGLVFPFSKTWAFITLFALPIIVYWGIRFGSILKENN